MEKLLTVGDLAEALQVSIHAVRSWIFYQRIPVVKIGSLVRIKPSTLAKIQEKGLPKVGDEKVD